MVELRDVESTDDDFEFGLGGKVWTFGDENVGINIIQTALRSRIYLLEVITKRVGGSREGPWTEPLGNLMLMDPAKGPMKE